MTGNKTRTVRAVIVSFLTSAFLGGAAALLLAATLSSPTSGNVRVTRVEPERGDPANSFLDLGILGACSNINSAGFRGPGYYQPGPDCRTTQVGYQVTLLLPIKANETDTDAEQPPYSLDRIYPIVTEGDSVHLVLVPVATAFQLVGVILHIVSGFLKTLFVGWIAIGFTGIAMILAWASFGVTWRYTEKVKGHLKVYNQYNLAVLRPFTARTGNAVWFIATAAALLTVALVGMAWSQYEKRKAPRRTGVLASTRKSSAADEELEMS